MAAGLRYAVTNRRAPGASRLSRLTGWMARLLLAWGRHDVADTLTDHGRNNAFWRHPDAEATVRSRVTAAEEERMRTMVRVFVAKKALLLARGEPFTTAEHKFLAYCDRPGATLLTKMSAGRRQPRADGAPLAPRCVASKETMAIVAPRPGCNNATRNTTCSVSSTVAGAPGPPRSSSLSGAFQATAGGRSSPAVATCLLGEGARWLHARPFWALQRRQVSAA